MRLLVTAILSNRNLRIAYTVAFWHTKVIDRHLLHTKLISYAKEQMRSSCNL